MRQRESNATKVVGVIVAIILWLIVFSVDKIRVDNNQKPWFCVPVGETVNGSGTYYGLFYKTIVKTNSEGKIMDIYITHWFDSLNNL